MKTAVLSFILVLCVNLTNAADKTAAQLLQEFQKTESVEGRRATASNILSLDKPALKKFAQLLQKKRTHSKAAYTKNLAEFIRIDYLKKLSALSDEDMRFIIKLKILWEPYLKYRGSRVDFKQNYIYPMQKVKDLLLTNAASIQDTDLQTQRKELLETAAYLTECNQKLGIDPDPVKTIKTPTNIPYTHLDSPQSYRDYLHLMERTLALVHAVAPAEAESILMLNVKNSRIIDTYEAEFTFFANEIRMLMGTVGWLADPLLSNCARDHSHDRKAGKASGHMSTIPGKKGFTDRAKRMGTSARSEGAGGGKSGIDAIMGLSYGGGHTGPLYSNIRNVVGVGVRQGACTAMYRGDSKLLHRSPVFDNYNFMPPGLDYDDLKKHSSMSSYYKLFQKNELGKILRGLENLRISKDMDKVYSRWFKIYAELRIAGLVEEVNQILTAGDAWSASEKYLDLRKKLSGNTVFEELAASLKEKFNSEDVRREVRYGKDFHKLLAKRSLRSSSLEKFIKSLKDKGSVYSEAAQAIVDNMKSPQKGFGNLKYFLNRNKALYDYGYPESLKKK